MIKMIVAIDRANAIGWQDGRLAYKISHDLKRFKSLTMGHAVLLGRLTYQSLGRPDGLPGRKNYVLTRRPYSEIRGTFGNVDIVSSMEYFRSWVGKGDDLWICGGASVYAEALDKHMVEEIYITLIHGNSGADVSLKHDLAAWKLFMLREAAQGRQWILAEHTDVGPEGNNPSCTYITLKRADPSKFYWEE